MGLLEKMNTAEDLRRLPAAAMDGLCREIRAFLLSHIAQTGGHLASNLGVVELTVALHRVLDTSRDRVVFDVGHQCYVHKLLTGRREGFTSLRALGSLAGFPKPAESPHDAFATGHASTSVSAALGMARARTLLGESYRVAAVIGDGALTGGMAYEGLEDAGQSGEPLVVVLNDNGMSITQNVGGVARHLARLRVKSQYFTFKKLYHKLVDPTSPGRALDRFLRKIKTGVKDALLPASVFESLGFTYLGPVDGHDEATIERLLRYAITLRRPVLLHLMTTKGKGYAYSEDDPRAYHGVSRFDVRSGEAVSCPGTSFSDVFGQQLSEMAAADGKITAITAAMPDGTGLSGYKESFPERFFDVGIAEAHAVTMAAGMAIRGLKPVCAIYATFLQRAYDSIVHDVALQNLPVVFAIDRAGLVGEDGETHHGIFDIAFLGHIPNMTIWAPASFAELALMLRKALTEANGPVAIRYPRGTEGAYRQAHLENTVLRKGQGVTLVTYGPLINPVLQAAELLDAAVVKLSCLKPLSPDNLSGRLFVVEDCVHEGSIGQRLAASLGKERVTALNLGDRFVAHGSREDLYKACGLDVQGIVAQVNGQWQG